MWLVVIIIINDMIDNASAYAVIHKSLVVKNFHLVQNVEKFLRKK